MNAEQFIGAAEERRLWTRLLPATSLFIVYPKGLRLEKRKTRGIADGCRDEDVRWQHYGGQGKK